MVGPTNKIIVAKIFKVTDLPELILVLEIDKLTIIEE